MCCLGPVGTLSAQQPSPRSEVLRGFPGPGARGQGLFVLVVHHLMGRWNSAGQSKTSLLEFTEIQDKCDAVAWLAQGPPAQPALC